MCFFAYGVSLAVHVVVTYVYDPKTICLAHTNPYSSPALWLPVDYILDLHCFFLNLISYIMHFHLLLRRAFSLVVVFVFSCSWSCSS